MTHRTAATRMAWGMLRHDWALGTMVAVAIVVAVVGQVTVHSLTERQLDGMIGWVRALDEHHLLVHGEIGAPVSLAAIQAVEPDLGRLGVVQIIPVTFAVWEVENRAAPLVGCGLGPPWPEVLRQRLVFREGAQPVSPGQVAIGGALARQLRLGLGQTLPSSRADLEIVGVFETSGALVAADVYGHAALMSQLSGRRTDWPNFVLLDLGSSASRDADVSKLDALVAREGAKVSRLSDVVAKLDSGLAPVRLGGLALRVTISAALGVVVFVVMWIEGERARHHVAVIRSMGGSASLVRTAFGLQVLGWFLVAMAPAALGIWWLDAWVLPAIHPSLDGDLTWAAVRRAYLQILLVMVLGAAWPVHRAGSTPPELVLRGAE